MTIFEHIFSVIGILIIIGGFIYGIYDSYFEIKGTSSSKASLQLSSSDNRCRLTLKRTVATRGIVVMYVGSIGIFSIFLRIFVILTRRIRLPLLAYGPHIFSNNI